MRGNPSVNKLEAYSNSDNNSWNDKDRVTWGGLAAKSLVLCALVVLSALVSAAYMVDLLLAGEDISWALVIGIIVPILPMIIISFVIWRAPRASMVLSIIYSICVGVMLGMVTGIIDLFYPGIALTAILGTMVAFAVTIIVHKLLGSRLSNGFRRFFFIALISFVLLQLILLVVSLFSSSVASLWGNYTVQMICSGVCIVLATFSLLIDIDNMTRMVEDGVDRQYEWLASFSLITTLIWLYVEILELLARLASRKD